MKQYIRCCGVIGVLLFVLSVLPHVAVAQESPKAQVIPTQAGQQPQERPTTPPSLSSLLTQTVVFVYKDETPEKSLTLVPGRILGTAFVIGVPEAGHPENSFPFIVTAKHVVAGESRILVRYTEKSGNAPVFVTYDLKELRKTKDLYDYSDDEGVDLTVFRTLAYQNVKILTFPIDLIISKNTITTENIEVSDRVAIPCLMQQFPGVNQNYPIFRDGTIALIPDEPISYVWRLGTRKINTQQRLIFINSVLDEGFSGAPVFLWPGVKSTPKGVTFGGKPWLLGVVHGFWPIKRNIVDDELQPATVMKREGLPWENKPDKQLYLYSQENSGTGIIFPAWRLLDILQSDAFKKRVQELTDELLASEKKK